jgi:hypothetical protein
MFRLSKRPIYTLFIIDNVVSLLKLQNALRLPAVRQRGEADTKAYTTLHYN